jgi:flagellin
MIRTLLIAAFLSLLPVHNVVASDIAAAKSRIESNRTLVKDLVTANNRGIGQLVDADLNEESSKLKALQTQELLAIQALGIANSASQNILRLFE